jgi:deferrochelatase/peroxidase EfeB
MGASTTSRPDDSNIQGLILRGYTHPYSCHLLFSFDEPQKAPGFFKTLYPWVTSSEEWGSRKPEQLLNLALTFTGLLKVSEVPEEDARRNFPIEFQQDPNPDTLGDLGASSPDHWWNNKQFKTSDIHCVVHAYALSAEALEQRVKAITAAADQFGARELRFLAGGTQRLKGVLDPDGVVHFGYRDGITNPELHWPASDPRNQADLANFLIGYAQDSLTQPAPLEGASLQFAKDGCYAAFRIIHQDVAAFEGFLTQQANALAARLGRTPEQAREWIAAKLMGRWRNGSPLMISPEKPEDATRDADDFGYKDSQSGFKCPFAAHIRVSNSRDQNLAPNEPFSQPPRLLRRGMPYGPRLTSETDDQQDRGLIGLFLCGSLTRQFELLMNWINMNDFSDVFAPDYDTQDGVLGNRLNKATVKSYRIPHKEGDITLPKLPSFCVTRGTAYTLFPSMASLRALAGLG